MIPVFKTPKIAKQQLARARIWPDSLDTTPLANSIWNDTGVVAEMLRAKNKSELASPDDNETIAIDTFNKLNETFEFDRSGLRPPNPTPITHVPRNRRLMHHYMHEPFASDPRQNVDLFETGAFDSDKFELFSSEFGDSLTHELNRGMFADSNLNGFNLKHADEIETVVSQELGSDIFAKNYQYTQPLIETIEHAALDKNGCQEFESDVFAKWQNRCWVEQPTPKVSRTKRRHTISFPISVNDDDSSFATQVMSKKLRKLQKLSEFKEQNDPITIDYDEFFEPTPLLANIQQDLKINQSSPGDTLTEYDTSNSLQYTAACSPNLISQSHKSIVYPI